MPTLLATPLPERKQYLVFLLLLAGFVEGTAGATVSFGDGFGSLLLVGLKIGAWADPRRHPFGATRRAQLHWLLAGFSTIASSMVASPPWCLAICVAYWPTPACRTSGWCPRPRFLLGLCFAGCAVATAELQRSLLAAASLLLSFLHGARRPPTSPGLAA